MASFSARPFRGDLGRLALLTVGATLAACGSITAVTPDGGDAVSGDLDANTDVIVTVGVACQQQAAAICGALEKCAAITVKFFYADEATCLTRLALGCMSDQMVPGSTRSAGDILACARDVGAASCPDLLASKLPASCLVKPGTGADGTVCGSNWQCASAFCRKDATCGTCADRGGPGGACTADDGCQTGLLCANSECVTPATLAMVCDANHPCRSDLYCTGTIGGTCQLKVGAGASCSDSDKACDLFQSVACNPFTKVCDRVDVASGGNACGIVDSVLTICVDAGPCPGVTLLQPQGVCANPAADGAACGDAANGVTCTPPATCDTGICRLPSVPNCQ